MVMRIVNKCAQEACVRNGGADTMTLVKLAWMTLVPIFVTYYDVAPMRRPAQTLVVKLSHGCYC